jgi:hypothetical protein
MCNEGMKSAPYIGVTIPTTIMCIHYTGVKVVPMHGPSVRLVVVYPIRTYI